MKDGKIKEYKESIIKRYYLDAIIPAVALIVVLIAIYIILSA